MRLIYLIDLYETRLELLIHLLILHSANAIEHLPTHYVLHGKLSAGYTVINKAETQDPSWSSPCNREERPYTSVNK